MSAAERHLTVGEFTRRMEAFERNVLAGQTAIEGKVDGLVERVVVLETANGISNKKTATWASLAAGGALVVVEAIRAALK